MACSKLEQPDMGSKHRVDLVRGQGGMASKGAMAGRQEEEERQVAAQTVTGRTKVCQYFLLHVSCDVSVGVCAFQNACFPLLYTTTQVCGRQAARKTSWHVSAVLLVLCCYCCV